LEPTKTEFPAIITQAEITLADVRTTPECRR
jgi:hypothetical protein